MNSLLKSDSYFPKSDKNSNLVFSKISNKLSKIFSKIFDLLSSGIDVEYLLLPYELKVL